MRIVRTQNTIVRIGSCADGCACLHVDNDVTSKDIELYRRFVEICTLLVDIRINRSIYEYISK